MYFCYLLFFLFFLLFVLSLFFFFFFLMIRPPPNSTLFPSPPLFRSLLALLLLAQLLRFAAPLQLALLQQLHRRGHLARLGFGIEGVAAAVAAKPLRRQLHDAFHAQDRKSTRLNSSHLGISYAVFCLK